MVSLSDESDVPRVCGQPTREALGGRVPTAHIQAATGRYVGGSVTMMLSLGCEHDGIARRGLPPRRSRPPRSDRLRRAVGLRAPRRGRQDGARASTTRSPSARWPPPSSATCRSSSSGSSELGADPAEAMQAFRASFDSFHAHTAPSDYYEGLIKAYVGDGLAADFYREIAAYLDAETREVIISSLRGHRTDGVHRRAGPRRHRRGPPARRPAGPVGATADGRGAHPGAARRRRP